MKLIFNPPRLAPKTQRERDFFESVKRVLSFRLKKVYEINLIKITKEIIRYLFTHTNSSLKLKNYFSPYCYSDILAI